MKGTVKVFLTGVGKGEGSGNEGITPAMYRISCNKHPGAYGIHFEFRGALIRGRRFIRGRRLFKNFQIKEAFIRKVNMFWTKQKSDRAVRPLICKLNYMMSRHYA